MKELKHINIWNSSVEITEQIVLDECQQNCSQLTLLNLSHNSFSAVPPVLACLAVNLTRLNMSYNGLKKMGHITSFPCSLKQLDLSYNNISSWFDLPAYEQPFGANIVCYSCESSKVSKAVGNQPSGGGHRNALMNSLCPHRRHLKLDNLRTLILTNNNLDKMQLTLECTEEDGQWDVIGTASGNAKARLIFPSISMLDLSHNKLKEIVHNVQELSNLSVLNISGNSEICELPPQMGLLSRLWNLNTAGCNLQEPLKSMIGSKKYKTMDVIGYLKSILEDARPYARIKLMIVGVQGIGKTSLLEQLRQEGLSYKRRPQDHWVKRMGNKNMNMKTSKGVNMSTVGVDIGLWIYDKKGKGQNSKGPVIFRTWDFGGQREYYATHQYFLSKRSLYLVVWKIPDGHKGIQEVRQWLVNIQARAPNSPVLIVGTHHDEMVEKNLIALSEELQLFIRNSLKHPGSKELLLEQRVPASYLALEDVITHLAADRRASGTDPVLNAEQYKTVVEAEMQYRYHKSFRDWPELHQATLFLHENGVLLHYEDATLRNLYFLDPQWLCDMLAHVVTIREINPFARTGVMKLTDLKHIFKSSNISSGDTRSYIVNLLNKFEVALTWDNCSLLIPSLLPSEEDLQAPFSSPAVRVKIPVRSRGWAVRAKKMTVSSSSTLVNNSFQTTSGDRVILHMPNFSTLISPAKEEPHVDLPSEFEITVHHKPEAAIRRFLVMSYFPSGFWSRLITRMLADDGIIEIVRGFFTMPKEMNTDFRLAQELDIRTEWVLWQTGMSLQYGSVTLFKMREILLGMKTISVDYRQLKFRLQQEGSWLDMDLSSSSILEIYFPVDSVIVKRNLTDREEFQILHLNPNLENVAKLLALAIDHIDILLEDWYPTLGTRFVHTSEGKFLVTRLIPCPKCWLENIDRLSSHHSIFQNLNDHLFQEDMRDRHKWHSRESIISDGDSGVGAESVDSSRKTSTDDHPEAREEAVSIESNLQVFSWMVEECILAACKSNSVSCPSHGEVLLSAIAPDTIFIDLGERYLIKNEVIRRGSLLGRGAFGFVFRGSCKIRGVQEEVDAALKMLHPVQPGLQERHSAIMAYKVTQGKWDRDPLQYACKAYCTARQELNILLNLRHPNIVPLIGVCTRPLALILDLAPQGALDATLKNYRRSGAKLVPDCLQEIILQVAKAIEYLHQQRIIYRDLKSENVLVWNFPLPFQNATTPVHVKLADYGISRLTLPSGSKGFGGTEGFMAPEIMKYNGEEEYTEKVDCFSFGMFIYELLTLHQPFEGHESVKECILEGGRPPLTYRETVYPSCILDLMVLCWSQRPRDRPSASQIVSIASSPEFIQLYDCTALDHVENVNNATVSVIMNPDENTYHGEFWVAGDTRIDLMTATQYGWDSYGSMQISTPATSLSLINNEIWVGDEMGNLYAYKTGTCSLCWKYVLGDAPIVAILGLEELNRVAIGLSNGRLFLVRSDSTPTTASMAEGSFVLTELGSSEKLFSLAHTQTDTHTSEIWVGEASGYISIFTIKEEIVTGHDCINHYNPIIEKVDRVEIVSNHGSVLCSYVYPGCMVYQWDTEAKHITATLDCTKLVPCSESLKPLTLEDLSEKCQVTAVSVFDSCVYVGTAWGCVIVAERTCLYPLMVFRPFEEEVKFILPLIVCNEVKGKRTEIVLGGKGYRSLSNRNTDMVLTPNQYSPTHQKKLRVHMLLWKHPQ
ncbi:hypothetical protein RUM44_012009 [Polyplax serrata]|uniref:non-specific serine/threonine protein kinase n=1 Tax=Polyplax serrata TaxID=468196 RepID=A0ABR1BA36_POLSC